MLNLIRYITLAFALIVATPSAVDAKEVSWSTPPECPAKAKLLAGVAKHLRRAIPAEVSIRGTIRRAKGSYTLVIHMGGGGVRTVTNADCFLLTETAALIIALAIDEQSPPPPVPKQPAVGVKDGERPPAVFGQTGTVTPTATTRLPLGGGPPLRVRARAMFGAESGSLPRGTTGFGAGVSGHLKGWSLGVSGWYWMERNAPAATPDAGGNVSLFHGELRGCIRQHWAGEWGTCVVGNAGWMRVQGYGVDTTKTAYAGMIAAGFASLWSLQLQKRVYLRIDIQAMWNLTNPVFVIQPGNEIVHEPSTFSARASAGVEMLIW